MKIEQKICKKKKQRARECKVWASVGEKFSSGDGSIHKNKIKIEEKEEEERKNNNNKEIIKIQQQQQQ